MAYWNLNWNDRFVAKLEQEVEELPPGSPQPFYFGVDGDALIFRFTEAEFNAVYTALKNGCDLTYGENGQQVLWYFMRNVEYPEVPEPVSCEDIQDCIEETPGTRQTIQDIVYQGTQPAGGTIYGQNNDLDRLFGMIRFLVDTIHDGCVDVFEIASVESDNRKRAKLFLEAIPGAELLPFDEAAEYVDDLLSGIGSEFNTQWTTTPITGVRDKICCGLFCLARNNDNGLTWALIRDYFWSLVSYESPGLNQFVDFVGYLITNSWAGEDIVNISFANFAAAMDASGRFGELLFPALSTIMQLGANNPDPDWELICEECVITWSHCFNFEEEDGGFAPWGAFTDGVSGHWEEGFGWLSDYAYGGGFAYRMVQIKRDIDPTTITKMTVTYNLVNGINGGLTRLLDTSTETLASTTDIPPDGPGSFSGSGSAAGAEYVGLRVQAGNQAGTGDPGGAVRLITLCVEGEGVNPFI